MTFAVRADSRDSQEGTLCAEKKTKKEAILTALDLLSQGMDGVIIEAEGRI